MHIYIYTAGLLLGTGGGSKGFPEWNMGALLEGLGFGVKREGNGFHADFYELFGIWYMGVYTSLSSSLLSLS